MCALKFNANDDRIYKIDYAHPGLVIIFNNKFFTKSPNLTRHGSEHDVARLSQIFDDLNYSIEIHLDKSASEMRRIVRSYATKCDFVRYSSLIVFIMSHGKGKGISGGTILSADEMEIYISEFIDPFKECESLLGKPKLFFIQACRNDIENQTMSNR